MDLENAAIVFQVTRLTGASFIVSTPKRATARGASDHQERPEASSRQPAMMDVIKLTGELRHSIETRKQIPVSLALQWDETKDETPLERRSGRIAARKRTRVFSSLPYQARNSRASAG
jgi:hypothetical protein